MFVQACHCRDCQRISGSAFVINMWVEEAIVMMLNESPIAYTHVAGSGRKHEVFMCAKCGTAVWSKYHASLGNDLMVRASTLDNPDEVEPMAHIFTRSKQKWLEITDHKPQFAGFYRLYDLWPRSSIDRFSKLKQQAKGSESL